MRRNREHLEIKKQKSYLSKHKYDFLLAIVISAVTVVMTRTHFTGGTYGTIEQNYIGRFGLSAVFLFFFCILIYYRIIILMDRQLVRWLNRFRQEKVESPQKVIRFWGILLIIAWLPYYLSYYPGGIYSDTFTSISWHYSNILSNRHPFLYNCLISLAIRFSEILHRDLTWAMGLFLAIQMILLEIEIIYFLYWMLVKRINRSIRIASMVFFIFFPLIPLYGISIWKDTPFCMAFLLWTISLTDLYLEIQKGTFSKLTLLRYLIAILLVAFTRNNGIYVIIFSTLIFCASTCKNDILKKSTLYISILLTISVIVCVQGPLYRCIGISPTDTVENLGIPLQQIGSVVAYDGNISEQQKEAINKFLPYENIKTHYYPCIVDDLKWNAGLDYSYLSSHIKDFLNIWLHLFFQNPSIYVKTYFLSTMGFWNPDICASPAYVQNFIWNNSYGLVQTDYFEKWFGFSFQHFVNPRNYISCAWPFWIFLVCTLYMMKHYGWEKALFFAPQIGVWLTLMIATPIAFSLRYIAPLIFTFPFSIITPFLLERE